jgi:nicotinamidase-related amidase
LLVDLQRDFFNVEPLRVVQDSMVERVNELIGKAENAGAPVIVVRTVHDPQGRTWALNMREDGQGVAIDGTDGAELLDGIKVRQPIEIRKTRDSAFAGTELERILNDLGVDHLVVAGVSTEACVAMTAAEAYARDLHVTLALDAIASADAEAHRQALAWLEQQYRQTALRNEELSFTSQQHLTASTS